MGKVFSCFGVCGKDSEINAARAFLRSLDPSDERISAATADFNLLLRARLLELSEESNSNLTNRLSIDQSLVTYVVCVPSGDGTALSISGNAVAISPTKFVTAYHNLYQQLIPGNTPSFAASAEISYEDADNNKVRVEVFGSLVVTQKITRAAGKLTFTDAVEVRIVESNYSEDWAVCEIVKEGPPAIMDACVLRGVDAPLLSYATVYKPTCALETELKLKANHFDISLFLSPDCDDDELLCMRVDYGDLHGATKKKAQTCGW